MSRPFPDVDGEIINVPPPQRRHWKRWVIGGLVLFFILLSRSLSVYVSALWFGSLGYSSVYWYILKLKVILFLIFLALTAGILRGGFWLLERLFAQQVLEPRTIIVNNQPVQFSPGRFVRPVSWAVALIFAFLSGLTMKSKWLEFANYLHQAPTERFHRKHQEVEHQKHRDDLERIAVRMHLTLTSDDPLPVGAGREMRKSERRLQDEDEDA